MLSVRYLASLERSILFLYQVTLGCGDESGVSRYLKAWNLFRTHLSSFETHHKRFALGFKGKVHTVLTFGMPLTEQLRVALYPAITERFTNGRVNLGASDRSCSLWVGGLYSTPT